MITYTGVSRKLHPRAQVGSLRLRIQSSNEVSFMSICLVSATQARIFTFVEKHRNLKYCIFKLKTIDNISHFL